MYDLETVGTNSESVVLSMACIHFDPESRPSYKELCDSAFFVKFDVKDQRQRFGRKLNKVTMEWWAKQCDIVRAKSFIPSADDVTLEVGIQRLRDWAAQFNDNDCWVWARGNMDEVILDSIEQQLGQEQIFKYNRWRDIRTAVDFLYGGNTGYCQVEYDGFDPQIHVYKHDPVHDCAYDIMMLLYGKSKGEK